MGAVISIDPGARPLLVAPWSTATGRHAGASWPTSCGSARTTWDWSCRHPIRQTCGTWHAVGGTARDSHPSAPRRPGLGRHRPASTGWVQGSHFRFPASHQRPDIRPRPPIRPSAPALESKRTRHDPWSTKHPSVGGAGRSAGQGEAFVGQVRQFRGSLRLQTLHAAFTPGPAPLLHRTLAQPKVLGDIRSPVTPCEPLPGLQPNPLACSPPLSSQAPTIRIPHNTGIPQGPPDVTTRRQPEKVSNRGSSTGPDGWDCPCSCPPTSVRTTPD